jgi:riboflavin synthase
MFTGIIQHVGLVRSVREVSTGLRLAVDIGPLVEGLSLGDSVAVNGLCLTAADIDVKNPVVQFDVVAESLARSAVSRLRAGGRVNLERALRADAGFDGHIVQGHVDGVATVSAIHRADQWRIEFTAADELLAQMAPKGSVAVDGVSLTLATAEAKGFSVAIIPTTLAETTLGDLAVGDPVNVEADILGKYVRRYLQQMLSGQTGGSAGGLTLEKLRDAGFA